LLEVEISVVFWMNKQLTSMNISNNLEGYQNLFDKET